MPISPLRVNSRKPRLASPDLAKAKTLRVGPYSQRTALPCVAALWLAHSGHELVPQGRHSTSKSHSDVEDHALLSSRWNCRTQLGQHYSRYYTYQKYRKQFNPNVWNFRAHSYIIHCAWRSARYIDAAEREFVLRVSEISARCFLGSCMQAHHSRTFANDGPARNAGICTRTSHTAYLHEWEKDAPKPKWRPAAAKVQRHASYGDRNCPA